MPLIQLQGLGLAYPHKSCFSGFTASIDWGQRIAIVGDNGVGKSSLLRILHGSLAPSEGHVRTDDALGIGYVAQILDDASTLSGGQRVNRALSQALADAADLLLLDEPTNHLDADNRRSLTRMLAAYPGALVLVTHDEALMDQVCDTIWHVAQGRIEVFRGRYADFLAERALQRDALIKTLAATRRAQEAAHEALMQEQIRASHARERGAKSIQNRKWATIKSPTKLGRGSVTAGHKQAEIRAEQQALSDQMNALRPTEVITPRFQLSSSTREDRAVVQVTDGAIGFSAPLAQGIQLQLGYGERLALLGKNGCGKSTLARAIHGDTRLRLGGAWIVPAADESAYLDQHYADLDPRHTVLQALAARVPKWTETALRRHLSDFLFRRNSEVDTPISALSGGEKARLSLACIAASTPRLLILDELTNNLDRRLRQHVTEIVKGYPGTLLLISHDEAFLSQVGVADTFQMPH
ncbi:MAG: ABC-F family ATP-binding cassette domain-containing protein [Burkholderiales bacterium]|nr:ABC-F family ATP-binding cassette domain-containing protein [Burkholderiales bacterium]